MDIALDDVGLLLTSGKGQLAASTAEEFALRVRPHMAKMAGLAARLASHDDRDDIVQEALARAWVKRGQFDPDRGSLSAWLLAITADQARKARRRRSRSLEPARPEAQPLDDHLDIEASLGRLTARQRQAIDCYYFVGLSVAETAAVMRCSQGTVKSTLADARNALRPLLETRDAAD